MSILMILVFLMVIGAIIAIETKELLSSVVCVGAVGLLLCIAFLFLGAPEIAVTQLVVEALVLIMLIKATIARDLTAVAGEREFFGMVATIAIVLVVALGAIKMLPQFPEMGNSVIDRMPESASATYVREGLERTGASNLVTAVGLGFRAYDTLGESIVLFCGVLGALAILRRRARKGSEDVDVDSDAA